MKIEQRGVAIIIAMGVVALAALAAVGIMATQSVWAHRLGRDRQQRGRSP